VVLNSQVLTNINSVAAGEGFSLGLKGDGTVVFWGEKGFTKAMSSVSPLDPQEQTNELFEKLQITKVDPVTGVPVGTNTSIFPRYFGDQEWRGSQVIRTFNLGVNSSGEIVTWVTNHEAAVLSNVVAIAAGGVNSLALKEDGTVISWGSAPAARNPVPVPDGLNNLVAISVGHGEGRRQAGLTTDGRVITWGSETIDRDATPTAGLSNVVAISIGYNHSLALKKDGSVTGWGFNREGQATGIKTPEAPYVSSGLVTVSGQVLSHVIAISAGQEYSLALKEDGTVVAWGNHRFYRDVPTGLSGVVAVAAGDGYCLAITTNSLSAIRRDLDLKE
jgi:alpha-tubulin suppressor-like RCC1 family protein